MGRAWFEYQGAGAAVSTHGSTGQISSQRERTLVTHSPRSRRTVLGVRSCLLLQQRQAGCHFVGFVGCLTCYVDSTSWYPPLLPEHRSRRTWRTISSTIPLAAAGFRRVPPAVPEEVEIQTTTPRLGGTTLEPALGTQSRFGVLSPTPPFIVVPWSAGNHKTHTDSYLARWPRSARRVLSPSGKMVLPLETLRELVKLAGLRTKILDRRSFDQLKNHVRNGNFLSSDDREALDLVWELREHRVFSDDEYDEQIDAQVLRIVGSAPAISPKHPACLPQQQASDGLLRTQSADDDDLDEHERAPGATPERGRQATEKPGLENLLSYLTTGVSWKGRNIVTPTWGCVSPYSYSSNSLVDNFQFYTLEVSKSTDIASPLAGGHKLVAAAAAVCKQWPAENLNYVPATHTAWIFAGFSSIFVGGNVKTENRCGRKHENIIEENPR